MQQQKNQDKKRADCLLKNTFLSVKCFHDHAYKGWKYVDLKLK